MKTKLSKVVNMGRQEFFEKDRSHNKKYRTIYKKGFKRKYKKLTSAI